MKISCTIHAIMGIVSIILFFLATVGILSYKLISKKKVPSELEDFHTTAQNVRYQTNLFYLFLGLILYSLSFFLGILQVSTITNELSVYIQKIFFTALILLLLVIGGFIFLYLHIKKKRMKDVFLQILIISGFILSIVNLVVFNYLLDSGHRFFF